VQALDLVHEIHTTELRSYRGCRRRWNWAFGEDLQPARTAVPLEFGIAYHYAMEKMYNPETWGSPRTLIAQFAEAAFYDACSAQRKKFNAENERGMSDDEERNYDELLALGRGMIHWYVMNHLPLDQYTPVFVEEKFQVPILDEDGNQLYCKCDKCWDKHRMSIAHWEGGRWLDRLDWDGLPVVYEGRVDAIVRDKFGNYWILDWKTTARMMNEDADIVLELDDQISGYIWALRKKLGLAIRGFIYVELKKGFPKPPDEMKVVRLGRSFSVSKNLDVDTDTYIRTVSSRDAGAYKAGLYDEFIAYLRAEGPRFINHHTVRRTGIQLNNFEADLLAQAREMTSPNTAIYPSPGRFSCGFCAYREPCLDKNQGGDYQYALETMYQIKPRYYVLKEATTDHAGVGQ
jgi:hypothetical protein